MLETSTSNYSEKKFVPIKQLDFKLPTLQKPISRGNININKLTPRRRQSNRLLPRIAIEDQNQIDQIKYRQNSSAEQIIEQPDRFAIEIEQKLKMVLNGKRLESENIEEQPQQDFETQINHNRQLIKQLKKKRQAEGNKSDYKTEKKLKIKDKKQRHGSLLQHPPRKQQKVKQKKNKKQQSVRMKTRISSKQDNLVVMQSQEFAQKTKQTKQKLQSQPNLLKSDYLFDNIQTFLENPRYSQNQSMKATLKRKQSILDLEKKLKIVETKIEHSDEKKQKCALHLTDQTKIQGIKQQQNSNEWRKIKVQPNKLEVLMSNIDRQMQRVNSYQAKNQHSLQKYLQNKRLLLQISIHKKFRSQTNKQMSK